MKKNPELHPNFYMQKAMAWAICFEQRTITKLNNSTLRRAEKLKPGKSDHLDLIALTGERIVKCKN